MVPRIMDTKFFFCTMNPSKFSVISHVLPLFCHSLVCDFRENCLRIVNAALSAPAVRSAPCFPRPFFRAQKTAAHSSPRGKPPRSWPLAANGAARCAAAPGRAPTSPLPVREKGRGLDGHALGIRIAPAHAGNACSDRLFLFLDRITPAYAGKRFGMRPPTKKKNGSPPRMRGTVLFCVIPVGMPPHGSPPPVRGKGGRVTFTLILSGSTPAYARKRSATKPRRTKRTDHPRPCGEKSCAASAMSWS